MRVLDLFAGLGGFSQAFKERGHEVVTLDFNEKFNCDFTLDIFDVTPGAPPFDAGSFDIVLASPPCEKFSVMQIGRNWEPGPSHAPKNEGAKLALSLVRHARKVIEAINPRFFIIENPMGKLRKLDPLEGIERRVISQCQYGRAEQKMTDLWGGFPPSLELLPPCKNGSPCHTPAVRGSYTGIQGKMTAEEKALIPRKLSIAICLAAEHDL